MIDEAVIRRVIGGPALMIEQLRHLIAMSDRDNVAIQVIGFAAGSYGMMSGAVTILGYAEYQDPDVAYLEYPGGGEWVESQADVARFNGMFEDVTAQAFTVAQSVALIEGQVRILEGTVKDNALVWRTSSYSGVNNECVELAVGAAGTAVRDSKNQGGRR